MLSQQKTGFLKKLSLNFQKQFAAYTASYQEHPANEHAGLKRTDAAVRQKLSNA
jgi:hypothetical protein